MKTAVTLWFVLSIAQDGEPTGVPVTVHVVSLLAKSELLVIVTTVPGGPDDGTGECRAGTTT